MAPRKDANMPAPSPAQTQQDASSEGIEDFEVPKLLVTQLANSGLPPNAKLEDDTVTALVKGSTVFINYLSSRVVSLLHAFKTHHNAYNETAATAQDIAASRAHKTISGADVLKALEILEFGDLVPAFQSELEIFRQGTKADKGKGKIVTDLKGKGKDKASPASSVKSATAPPTVDLIQNDQGHHTMEIDGEKRVNGGAGHDFDVEMRDIQQSETTLDVVRPVTLAFE